MSDDASPEGHDPVDLAMAIVAVSRARSEANEVVYDYLCAAEREKEHWPEHLQATYLGAHLTELVKAAVTYLLASPLPDAKGHMRIAIDAAVREHEEADAEIAEAGTHEVLQ